MDYDFLRQEGIRHLERMAGRGWTDFNAHDPGITILEQLCYALTDLGYRIDHDIPDLLASDGADPYESLYPPAEILTTHPVTPADLWRLVVDVQGVKNAWIEPVEQTVHYDPTPSRQQLHSEVVPQVTEPVALKGLCRVMIEISDDTRVRAAVARRLHQNRGLCQDFVDLRILTPQKVIVTAKVEIAAVEDAEALLLAVLERLADYISPPVPFTSLDSRLAAGQPVEEIFDGPRLGKGFVDAETLAASPRRTTLATSDLIHEIMEVPGVEAVRYIALGEQSAEWFLKLSVDQAPRLDLEKSAKYVEEPTDSGSRLSGIRLYRKGIPADVGDVTTAYYQRQKAKATGRGDAGALGALAPPPGRDRHVGDYHSIQHHFPALYGLAEMGLPESAPPRRQAQARQLKAYLTFFDQILADAFAQLAHLKDLFSHSGKDQTYFTQAFADSALGLENILDDDNNDDNDDGNGNDDDGEATLVDGRKNRFLNHLLARFAEELTDYSLALFEATPAKQMRGKQAFLQRYPRISSARGTAFNELAPWGPSNLSGLEERLWLKLGLDQELVVVEHVLLRPMEEDRKQSVPLLAASEYRDPYSLHLSAVLPREGRFSQNGFRSFVEKTIREETPAHLIVHVRWLEKEAWGAFGEAHREWLRRRRQYWSEKLSIDLEGLDRAIVTPTHLLLRDARDRLIDLLGFGETYPLQDVAVKERLMVPFNTSAKIPIDPSQSHVEYELHENEELVGGTVSKTGTGGEILLETPPISEDVTYKIFARKIHHPQRQAYLHQQATVKVGLDLTLDARIDADLLDPRIDSPADTDPRIVDHGAEVEVRIDASQEGVDYQLVHDVGAEEVELSPQELGTRDDITLLTVPVFEDTEIRIRATKTFDPSEGRDPETGLLEVVLPLKARADPALRIEASPVIAFDEGPVVVIAGSQRSASYRVYLRALSDRDFLYGGEPPDAFTVEGQDYIWVSRPPRTAVWEVPEGFEAATEPEPGNGGELRLTLSPLASDGVVIVAARKEHAVSAEPGARTIPSELQLERALLILVRPDPAVELALEVPVAGTSLSGTVEVSGGQPGVFYHFSLSTEGPDLGLPAYFHQLDESDPELNKGLEQLRIDVDFVVARGGVSPPADSARARPPAPWVEIGSLPLDDALRLHVRAVKARTRVAVPLSRSAAIPSLPEIRLEEESVAPGAKARIVVVASRVGEKYQPFLDGEPVKRALNGNGENLVFLSDSVNEETTFEVHITQPDDPGLAVTRIVELTVRVS